MVRNHIRRWLAPLLRLFEQDSIWRAPMIAGTVLGLLLLLGGPIGALLGFAIGFFGVMIVRIYVRTMRP